AGNALLAAFVSSSRHWTACAQIRKPLKVAFVLSLAGNRPMIAGRATAADGIIGLAGAANAFGDFDGYKLVNDEAIIAAKPEAVLVMQRGEHGLSADTVFAQPALAMTPAAERKAFVLHGRTLSARLRAAHGARRARASRASLSGHRCRRARSQTRRRRCAVRSMTAATRSAAAGRRNLPLARRAFPLAVMLVLVAVVGVAPPLAPPTAHPRK